MGNLHQGHLELIKASLDRHQETIVSIFVNPLQFNNQDDFSSYPKTLKQDLTQLDQLFLNYPDNKKLIVFCPETTAEIYPSNFQANISLKKINHILEGSQRPGHFDGVCTVLYQLFKLVDPHTSYFGQKDYQQLVVVKTMVNNLDLKTHIKGLPTVREAEGLALSSRNSRLSLKGRKEALKLHQTLLECQEYIQKTYGPNGHSLDIEDVKQFLKQKSNDKDWYYLELRDAIDFENPNSSSEYFVLVAALNVEGVRLLDNIIINLESE
jgi:pantoate--beta-alanine ligase